MKTISEQIAAVEREIGMRARVYPRWVESGKYTQGKADHEMECMEAMLETLRAVKEFWFSQESSTMYDRLGDAIGHEQGDMF